MAKQQNTKRPRLSLAFERGTRHWVQPPHGLPCPAEIIDTRTAPAGHTEFYIHYCNQDKRLDGWIGADRFLSPGQVQSIGEKYFVAEDAGKGLTSRNLRRRFSDTFVARPPDGSHVDPLTAQLEREHEEATKVKNIQKITIGCWEIDCWYFSPFPDAYSTADRLFFCERCCKYMRWEATLAAHLPTCPYQGPPGPVIYLNNGVALYELDGAGAGQKLYCQNFCLLAKLFLDHKTIYYDVSPFQFYILCEVDERTVHPVGFFSKEKVSADGYNLACIMVLPPHQRKGYGRFLMSLSYELTRRQGTVGTPERPLSDLGLVSYRRFWSREILLALTAHSTLESLSRDLGFTVEDISDTLKHLSLLKDGQKIHYNARLVKELLAGQCALKPGAVEFVPSALSWPAAGHHTHHPADEVKQGKSKRK